MHTLPLTDPLRALRTSRILPLVDTDTPRQMPGLADAFLHARQPVAEVTLRRSNSLDALRQLAQSQDMIVGAGTVMTERQAADAVDAGAQFLVSPGLSIPVAREAARLSVPIIPGVATATELMTALENGITAVKFFPAATSGGPSTIRALAAVAPTVSWVPTGGIDAGSARDYFAIPNVLAVGGSWMCPPALVEEGRWSDIATLLEEASELTS